jgi:hypothetical protein
MLIETNLKMTTRPFRTTLSQLLSRSLLAGNRNTETPALTVRKSATSRLRLVIALIALWVPCISWPQQSAIGPQPQIEIQYGYVAQHYTTSWSDPALPAGVTRGTPPPTEIPTDNAEVANESPPTNGTTAPEGISTPTDSAILYAMDWGEAGMELILSAKTTIRPGDCIAVERAGNYVNLRKVNAGYCDPTNRDVVARLRAINQAAAQRCMTARQSQQLDTVVHDLTEVAEVAMLCDGS